MGSGESPRNSPQWGSLDNEDESDPQSDGESLSGSVRRSAGTSLLRPSFRYPCALSPVRWGFQDVDSDDMDEDDGDLGRCIGGIIGLCLRDAYGPSPDRKN